MIVGCINSTDTLIRQLLHQRHSEKYKRGYGKILRSVGQDTCWSMLPCRYYKKKNVPMKSKQYVYLKKHHCNTTQTAMLTWTDGNSLYEELQVAITSKRERDAVSSKYFLPHSLSNIKLSVLVRYIYEKCQTQ